MTRALFFRPVLLTVLTAVALGGCASLQQAVDKARGEGEPAAAPEPAPAATPAQSPAPAAPKPPPRTKPVVKDKPEKPKPPPPAPEPVETVPDNLPGPAWLKRCQSVQLAGGIVRCESDTLLAKPSPTVQVFTRDPKRVVEGQIRLRAGLPRIYRFFVVP